VSIDSNAEVEELRRTIVRLVLRELKDGDPVPIQLEGPGLEKLLADLEARLSPLTGNQLNLVQSVSDLRSAVRGLASQASVDALKSQIAELKDANFRIDQLLRSLAEAGNHPLPPIPPTPPAPPLPPPTPTQRGKPGHPLRMITGVFGSAGGADQKPGSARSIVITVLVIIVAVAGFVLIRNWLGSDAEQPKSTWTPSKSPPSSPNENEVGDFVGSDDPFAVEYEKGAAGNGVEPESIPAEPPVGVEPPQPKAKRDRGQ
jgi:hypothetical protein